MKLHEIRNSKEFDFPCIYMWTNLISGKKYIGQTQNMGMRFKAYKKGNFNPYMLRAVYKYGINNFEIDILERDVDIGDLNNREQYWMNYYNSFDKKCGYNLCPVAGATRGVKRTEETKKKMSESAIKRFSVKGGTWTGRKHSEETKMKMSKTAIELHKKCPEIWANRHIPTEEEKQKTSNFFKQYWSENTHSWSGKTHKEESKKKMSESARGGKRNIRMRRVSCFTLDEEYVCTYDSASEAARNIKNYKASSSGIISCLKGRTKSAYGFIWRDEGLYHES